MIHTEDCKISQDGKLFKYFIFTWPEFNLYGHTLETFVTQGWKSNILEVKGGLGGKSVFFFFLENCAYVLSEWSHILSKIYRHSGQSESFKTLVGNCNFHFAKAAYFENIFSAYLLHTVGQSRIPVHSCRNIFIS